MTMTLPIMRRRRRTGGFTPLSLSPDFWLESDTADAVLLANSLAGMLDKTGFTYSLWYDLASIVGDPASSWPSIGSLTLAQSGAGDRFDVETAGGIGGNGLIGDGTKAMYSSANLAHADDVTVVIAFVPTDVAISRHLVSKFRSSDNNRIFGIDHATTTLRALFSGDGTNVDARTIGTIANNKKCCAGMRKSGTVCDTIFDGVLTSQSAVTATLHNFALPITLGAEGISSASPDPGAGAFKGIIRAAAVILGAVTNEEFFRIVSDFEAMVGISMPHWTGNVIGPYTQFPDLVMTDVYTPTAGPPTAGTYLTASRMVHHHQLKLFPSTGRIFFAHTAAFEDEDAAGETSVANWMAPNGTWGANVEVIPPQDVQSGLWVDGQGVFVAPDCIVEVSGQTYLINLLVARPTLETSLIAVAVNADGTLGSPFRIIEATYTPASGFSVIGFGSSDATLRAALRLQHDIHGLKQYVPDPSNVNERHVVATPNGDGQLLALFKRATFGQFSMVNAATGTEITGTGRVSTIPCAPNRYDLLALGDGRIALVLAPQNTGTPLVDRNPLTLAITDKDSLQFAIIMQLRSGTDDLPTLSGLGSGHGRSGANGYPEIVHDAAENLLYTGFSRTGKQITSIIKCPVPVQVIQQPDKAGGGDMKCGRGVITRPVRIRTLSPRLQRTFFNGTFSYLSRTTNLLTGTAGTVVIGCRPMSVTGVRRLLAMADTSAGNYLAIYTSGTKLTVVSRIAIGDLTHAVEATTVLTVDTNYVFTIRSNDTAWSMRINGADAALNVLAGSNNGNWFGDVASPDVLAVGALVGSGGPSEYFSGYIDTVSVVQGALTADELDDLEAWAAARSNVTLV